MRNVTGMVTAVLLMGLGGGAEEPSGGMEAMVAGERDVVEEIRALPRGSEPPGTTGPSASADTVRVAPPTGDEGDRASILSALGRARPGEAVQFGRGTYLVGEVIRVGTPGITLLGHPDGTVLRGCDPEAYEADEREAVAAGGPPSPDLAARCGMFELTGGEVTVRGITFENSRLGLLLGCCHTERRFRPTPGGYTIEGNVFRNSLNGIRPWTTEPSVIRGNEFIDTFHAISGVGSHLHVLDNEISVPDPSRVPGVGHPSFAIALGPLPGVAAGALGLEENGQGYVIDGNRIEGHTDGIFVSVYPGVTFRGNVIRDNTIRVARVPIPPAGPRPYIVNVTAEADSTIVGIPIALYSRPGFGGSEAEGQEGGWFEDNLIEGNRILGAEGVGLALQRGRGNRIVGNAISGVAAREPFPGNTVVSSSGLWGEANGSGIWISPDSEDNEVAGNTFADIAGDTVVMGDAVREERGAAPAALPGAEPNDPTNPTADAIDRLVHAHMESREIPGLALVVMREGEVLKQAAYGRASLDLDAPVTSGTIFPYASMAKVFAATAILQLVEDGHFGLDDAIGELLPGLPDAWSGVRVGQLLSNTSGLPDMNQGRPIGNPFLAPSGSRDDILAALREQPVAFGAAEGFAYNQTNYLLLGMLLEQRTGRGIEDHVRDEIAEPLGLESLAYGDSRDVIPGRATWYTRMDLTGGAPRAGPVRPLWIEYPPYLHMAAGLNGTALDLARFVDALARGRVLGDRHVGAMWEAASLADGSVFRFEDGVTGAGLGWWVHDAPAGRWVAQGGAASGHLRHYVDEGLTIVVLTNLQGAEPEALAEGIAESARQEGGTPGR